MLSIDKNQILIEHFKDIIHVDSSTIQVAMNSYHIAIKGTDLHVLALGKEEFLIEGMLKSLAFIYEK